MSSTVRITALVENTAKGQGIIAEHGLSLWIESEAGCILFDTGQGLALPPNIDTLDIALEQADAIVLSHGHYDHTGALDFVLDKINPAKCRVYAHPAVLDAKYSGRTGVARYIGMPEPTVERLRTGRADMVWTETMTSVLGPFFVTGQIPRNTEFEDTGGKFFLDQDCTRPDPILDDQAMFFESAAGTVVILGCAHSGVINILRQVQKLTDGKPIHTVLGGMHLVNASPERVEKTIDALREFNLSRLAPAHCTGMAATVRLWQAFPDQCFGLPAGSSVEFTL